MNLNRSQEIILRIAVLVKMFLALDWLAGHELVIKVCGYKMEAFTTYTILHGGAVTVSATPHLLCDRACFLESIVRVIES